MEPRRRSGRQPKEFACPDCGVLAASEVRSYPKSPNLPREYRRRYQCREDRGGCGRPFYTVEAVEKASIVHLRVARSGGAAADTAFDRAMLVANMDQRVVKTLTTSERDEVVDATIRHIQDQVARDPKVSKVVDGHRRIYVSLIQESVFEALRTLAQRRAAGDAQERFTMALVQYALGSFGEKNPTRPTWKDAGAFLEWLDEEFGADGAAPHKAAWARGEVVWAAPSLPLPVTVSTVLKNFRPEHRHTRPLVEGDLGEVSPGSEVLRRRVQASFEPQQIRTTLATALKGRPADTGLVYDWVMWGFAGQVVLRSSQISSRIAEALRGLDDIAYLRWVAIGKELTVRQLRTEAQMLIQYPSPHLKLSRLGLPPPLTPGPGQGIGSDVPGG